MNKKIFYGIGIATVIIIMLLVIVTIYSRAKVADPVLLTNPNSLVMPNGRVLELREDAMISPNIIIGPFLELVNDSEFRMVADFSQSFVNAAGQGKEIIVRMHPETGVLRSEADGSQVPISIHELSRGDIIMLSLLPGETILQIFEVEAYNPFRVNYMPLSILNPAVTN